MYAEIILAKLKKTQLKFKTKLNVGFSCKCKSKTF